MEMCTAQGHVVGMLDRDQRTAKMCVFDRHVVSVRNYQHLPESPEKSVLTKRDEAISHRSVPGRTSPHSSCKTRKNGHFWKSLHRLKHALIVGAYLSLVTFPSILSAPTIRMSSREPQETEPRWFNPCGGESTNGASSDQQHITDEVLIASIKHIIRQASIAQEKAKAFQNDFVERTFNTDFLTHHNRYKDQDWDWLPTKNLPKKLGEPIPLDHLETLEFQSTLLDVYGYLQQIAVGLEQVVWDEEKKNSPFKTPFTETRDNLYSVLCEVHMAINENNLSVLKNVNRDIMGEKYRNMDNNTSMNFRNWIIYRDYLNMLEYILEVFDYFKKKLPTIE